MEITGGTIIKKGKILLTVGILCSLTLLLYLPTPQADTGTLPSDFDLRDVNGQSYVTPIRRQTGGTCWCHGALAAMESNLLMTGTWEQQWGNREPNLAEYHLDWWNGFNQFNNDDTTPPSGGGLTVHQGGDYRITAAYLTRGEGAVFSSMANDGTEFDETWYTSAPDRFHSSYEYYYVRDIEWYVAQKNLANIDIIKDAIMTEGAVGTCMYVSGFDYNYTAYYPGPKNPTHAIAIIGWDDNKVTEGPHPGAWLCKNSWGSGWGLEGYFWISYYDTHACQDPEMGAVSFQDVEPLTYKEIYYHDYHGWRDTLTSSLQAFNAFTATDDHTLSAVSFYTPLDNTGYVIKIYDGFVENQLTNELSSLSGTVVYTGFHTLDLTTPVPLKKDDDFYISLELSQGGQPYDRTSEVKVLLGMETSGVLVKSAAHPGESYFYGDDGWTDLTTLDETANFCIKGLVAAEADVDCTGSLSWSKMDPGSTVTGSFTLKNTGENLSRLSWEIQEYPTWGTWSFTPKYGDNISPGDDPVTIEVTVVIPEEDNTDFTGDIKIVNTDNPDDYSQIPVSLSTAKQKWVFREAILVFLEKFADLFPLWESLMGIFR